MKIEFTPAGIAKLIDAFIGDRGTIGDNDWSDFTDYEISDPALELIRHQCESLADLYPSTDGHWCNENGIAELRAISKRLKMGGI